MPISNFDELNVLWVGEMNLSPKEKYLRIAMITDFEMRLRQIFEKENQIINSGLSEREILYAIALLTIPIINQYRSVAQNYYTQYVNLLASGGGSGLPEFDSWIKNHSVDMAKWIQQTTSENYNDSNIFSDDRIKTISRSEINALCELATLDSFYKNGYSKKKWICFVDGKERKSHNLANGQVRSLKEPFHVGNSLMMFPQDSSLGAGAKEIVNCRCIMEPVK